MSGWGRAMIWGGLAAVLLVGGLVAAVMLGVVTIPGSEAVTRILVIGTAPDEKGTELAAFAFVLDAGTGQVTVLDTLQPTTVSGTSATNAREAFPFGGGQVAAEALASQLGGETPPWVVLPSATWAKLVDDSGGLNADVPERVSSYAPGTLTLIQPGSQVLTGEEAVALAGSVSYFAQSADGTKVLKGLSSAVSAIVGGGDAVRALVESGEAESSLAPDRIPGFASR